MALRGAARRCNRRAMKLFEGGAARRFIRRVVKVIERLDKGDEAVELILCERAILCVATLHGGRRKNSRIKLEPSRKD